MDVNLIESKADRQDMNVKDTNAKPGWYPDPEAGGMRFWDGRSWSPQSRQVNILEAGLGGPLILHGRENPDYSYRSVAQLSRRGQETTWPAMAQKF